MKSIDTMEELKAKAIVVTDGMESYFPSFKSLEKIKLSEIQAKNLSYAYNNSVVAFVDENGTFYVIPYFSGIQSVLLENGYTKDYFYVPFSNWDYPVAYKERWDDLWRELNA